MEAAVDTTTNVSHKGVTGKLSLEPQLCANDQEETAEIFCSDCDQYLCSLCDTVLHKSKAKHEHNRVSLTAAAYEAEDAAAAAAAANKENAASPGQKRGRSDDITGTPSKKAKLEAKTQAMQDAYSAQTAPSELLARARSRSANRRSGMARRGSVDRHLYKLLIVGNAKCGKSSIIQRYANNEFAPGYKTTIGADYFKKVVQYDDDTTVQLQLWDIAGQDRFASLTRPYYRNATAAIVVCDVTRQETVEATIEWKKALDDKLGDMGDGKEVPVILLANKCDLMESGMSSMEAGARLQQISDEMGFKKWFLTSAKMNNNIDDAMRYLIGLVLEAKQAAKQNGVSTPQSGRRASTIDFEAEYNNPGPKKQQKCYK